MRDYHSDCEFAVDELAPLRRAVGSYADCFILREDGELELWDQQGCFATAQRADR